MEVLVRLVAGGGVGGGGVNDGEDEGNSGNVVVTGMDDDGGVGEASVYVDTAVCGRW